MGGTCFYCGRRRPRKTTQQQQQGNSRPKKHQQHRMHHNHNNSFPCTGEKGNRSGAGGGGWGGAFMLVRVFCFAFGMGILSPNMVFWFLRAVSQCILWPPWVSHVCSAKALNSDMIPTPSSSSRICQTWSEPSVLSFSWKVFAKSPWLVAARASTP